MSCVLSCVQVFMRFLSLKSLLNGMAVSFPFRSIFQGFAMHNIAKPKISRAKIYVFIGFSTKYVSHLASIPVITTRHGIASTVRRRIHSINSMTLVAIV